MQTRIHPDALELAELLRPSWAAKTAALTASGVPVALDGATLTPDVQRLGAEIGELTKAASEQWASFEREREALAGTDAASDPDSPQFQAAEAANKAYNETADLINRKREARDRLLNMEGVGAPQGVNGPQDGDRSVGAALGEVLRRSAGDVALTSDDYRRLLDNRAFTVNERKSVEALLIRADQEHGRDNLMRALQSGQPMASLVTGADDNSAGALITPRLLPGITVPLLTRPLRLVEMITVGQTDSDTVEYVEMTGFLNNAAETAEATASSGTSGTKPESGLDMGRRTVNVVTLAHWIPATKRALADAGQLRTLIDSILRLGLDLRLDQQVAHGNGQGENIRGISNTVGIGQVRVRIPSRGDSLTPETILDTIHRAITVVRLAFFEPTAVGIHPNDWERIRLARAGRAAVANVSGTSAGSVAEGDYLMGDPMQAGTERIWGLIPVISAAFREGHPIIGDYRMAVLWLREGIQVLASDSHNDFFIRNLVAILAEFRTAFGVLAPSAFCEADLEGAIS